MPLITEDTLAVSLAERECSRLRYVCQWKRWIICGKDGQWRLDEKQSAFQLARLLCREASASAHAAGDDDGARALASYRTVAAVEMLARSDPRLAIAVHDVPAEIMNPKTGRRGPHAGG